MKYSNLVNLFNKTGEQYETMGLKDTDRPLYISFAMYYPGDRIYVSIDTKGEFRLLELSTSLEAVKELDGQLEDVGILTKFITEAMECHRKEILKGESKV